MKKLSFLLIIILAFSQICNSQTETKTKQKKTDPTQDAIKAKQKKEKAAEKNLDPKGNMELLNQWGERPANIQRLYLAAWNIFAAKPLNGTYADLADDAKFRQLCKENGIIKLGGPMLGTVSPTGVNVWLRTFLPARVEVKVTIDGSEKSFGPVQSTLETDMSAIVPVTGLKPAMHYSYRVLVDGKPIPIPKNASIITPPDGKQPTKESIAFGTCFHRWGLGNQKQADVIISREPSAMLIYGDIAVQDRDNNAGLHRADYLLRDLFPAWQSLVASVPVYATWDDHDYFDNDLAGIPSGFTKEDKEKVWDVFRHAWNNPSYGFGEKDKGVFLRTRVGPCDIIMTDERYFRTGEKGSFLGDEQMKWLEAQLLDCKGPFIILSNGTMWSDYVSDGKDSWGVNDPEGREKIFNLIEKNHIGGVLLISGDRHGARGFRIPRPSGYNFYEFEAGSLGGRTGPPPTDPKWTTQLYGISGRYAFGEFTFDTTVPDPEVTFRLIGDDASIIYELKLSRSQLTPPGK
ncbi:MAG: alkaline phosphatase D family protein [Bacteroidia bacterium]|nr:alkaline phosphatase D family protein [Bacteroidia bacterium]